MQIPHSTDIKLSLMNFQPTIAANYILTCTFTLLGGMEVCLAQADKNAQSVEIKATTSTLHRSDTASKIVLTHADIKKYGDNNIADVLRRQAGISVVGNEIRMRGMGNGYTQILVDGEPLARSMSIDSINPAHVERIDIMPTATADMSTQAIAGSINIVMQKRPTNLSRDVRLQHQFGAGEALSNLAFQYADKSERSSYQLKGEILGGHFTPTDHIDLKKSDAFGINTAEERTSSRRRMSYPGTNLTSRFTWNLDSENSLALSTRLFYQTVRSQTELHTAHRERKQTTLSKEQDINEDVRRSFTPKLSWTRALSDQSKLVFNLSADVFLLNVNREDSNFDSSAVKTKFKQLHSYSKERELLSSGDYTTAANQTHRLKMGWDAGRLSLSNQNLRQHHTILPVSSSEEIPENAQAKVNRLALFAQDEWQTSNNWSNYLGARWESFNQVAEGTGYARFSSNTSVLSPIFQSLWKLSESKENQVRFAFAKTFKNPSLASLTPTYRPSLVNTSYTPDTRGNPHLKPEIAAGIDLAFEHFGADEFNLRASAYAKQLQNLIQDSLQLNSARWVLFSENQGRAHAHGIELDIKFPAKLWLESAKNLDIRVNVARNWSSVDTVAPPNNRIAEQTRWTANTSLDYRPSELWGTGISYSYSSGGDIRLSNTINRMSNPSRRLDSYFFYKLSKDSNLRISLRNLLAQNRTSAEHIAPQFQADSSFFDSYRTIYAHRSLGLNLEMKW